MDKTAEQLYQEWLMGMKLYPEDKLHPTQRKQLRWAFMGGMSQFIRLMSFDFPNHSDEECHQYLDKINAELVNYWKKEVSGMLPKN